METVTTLTCHIWHADELGYHMVDIADFSDIASAKEEARSEALGNFSADLGSPHRIWFTTTTFQKPAFNETVVETSLPPLPEGSAIDAAVSVS